MWLIAFSALSYSTVVLYIRINEVWGFLATYKSAKYLLSDGVAALVRHSQAKKCKPLHQVTIKFKKFLIKKIFLLTD